MRWLWLGLVIWNILWASAAAAQGQWGWLVIDAILAMFMWSLFIRESDRVRKKSEL